MLPCGESVAGAGRARNDANGGGAVVWGQGGIVRSTDLIEGAKCRPRQK
jgi:hypothetical protein